MPILKLMAKISPKNFFSMISLSFVVIVLAVVVVNIQKSQDINEKASVLQCPSSYICQEKGIVESCSNGTSFCCPKKGARWTTDLTKCPNYLNNCKPRPGCLDSTPRCLMPEPAEGWCPVGSVHPFPTQPPTPTANPIPLRTLLPVGTPVRVY